MCMLRVCKKIEYTIRYSILKVFVSYTTEHDLIVRYIALIFSNML